MFILVLLRSATKKVGTVFVPTFLLKDKRMFNKPCILTIVRNNSAHCHRLYNLKFDFRLSNNNIKIKEMCKNIPFEINFDNILALPIIFSHLIDAKKYLNYLLEYLYKFIELSNAIPLNFFLKVLKSMHLNKETYVSALSIFKNEITNKNSSQ